MKRLVLLFSLLILFAPLASTVSAMSDEQRRLIQSGVYYFDIEQTASCTTGIFLTGSENGEKIYNYMIGKGLQPYQAAGIMGNLQAESGLNPKRVQGTKTPEGDRDNITVDDKTGYGLAQWTSRNRQQGLADLAASKGVISGDLGIQLEYLFQELEGPYKGIYDEIRAETTLDGVSDIFMTKFERPKNQSESAKEERRKMGRALLAQYGSNTAGGGASGGVSCVTDGSGQVVGGYSLPLDRKWYDQHPEWFTKPHHDYPAADIPVPVGTPVYSMTAGRVVSAPVGGPCGAGVRIDAGNGLTFGYCHGSDGGAVPGAKEGDFVQAGQLIMHSANTGRSSGPHLHVEIAINGSERCPQTLFTGIVSGSPPEPATLPTTGCTN